MKKTTILLADDHTIVRQGIRALLSAEADMEVIGEAENGRQAIRAVQKLQPEIVVVDIAMPRLGGVETIRRIRRQYPQVKVLVLSMYADDEYVFQAAEAGATGYLVKGSPATELIAAIREAIRGRAYFSSAVSQLLVQDVVGRHSQGGPEPEHRALTPREREVLQLIAEGQSNKEIARELTISVKTVEKHRQHLMDRLNIHTVVGLTWYAIRSGVVRV